MKPAVNANNSAKKKTHADSKSFQQFEDYLTKRDYTGAITLLEVQPIFLL